MSRSSDPQRGRPLALATALVAGGLLCLALSWGTWMWHLRGQPGRSISEYLFARQDMWMLDAQAFGLLVAGFIVGLRVPRGRLADQRVSGGTFAGRALVPAGILLVVLLAWLGRTWVFHGYSVSRDEVMVELTAGALAHGMIGWPIPEAWLEFRHAMQPEFYSPYGSDTHWTSIYLPVHAAIRSLFQRVGLADLAAPVTLGAGLVALWHIARRLNPDRRDAALVTMVMALTSAQLLVTGMTPYAMTSHFAFNMIWLALVLRGGALGHGLAALVAILAAGLHQWHFPLLFIAPFILWMAANRRWGPALFHICVALALMVIWARLWPMALAELVGPAPPSDVHRTNSIVDKLISLFGRLDDLQPLLNISRLIAWNNLLLLPLAGLAVLGVRWRSVWRDVPVTVPLLLGVIAGLCLALYQGYGWGFRYMHGQIGALCLLAGLGWRAVVPRDARYGRALLVAGALFALLGTLWQARDTEHYVRGYAKTMAAIRASDADVVLVDIRGGYFMTDLVRFGADGAPGKPAVMALQMLKSTDLAALCARYDVAVMDFRQFQPLGVYPLSPIFKGDDGIVARRAHLARMGCDRPVIASPAG
ncbi:MULTISPECIES: MFS transporter [Sphingobium]|uniref:MFS transporter n=1 Tax=Sphingobium TaxID=165695 RepID=UPI0015EC2382|nr:MULTISPECIES: MFS transporter [Sphingobium]MCW2362213.1 hypothetical protein [Sphingobium sp. B10D3B]MCW2401108.1 hypothetical protein [Sphingobium sp. B10D7B]MCW2408088.1 hypothetical protein [Sphingobium xanthum]